MNRVLYDSEQAVTQESEDVRYCSSTVNVVILASEYRMQTSTIKPIMSFTAPDRCKILINDTIE